MRARAHLMGDARRIHRRQSYLVYVLNTNATDVDGDVLGPSEQAVGSSFGDPQTEREAATASMPEGYPSPSGTLYVGEEIDAESNTSTAIKAATTTLAKSTIVSRTASRLASESATALTRSKTARILSVSAPTAGTAASQSATRSTPIASSSTTTASSSAPTGGSSTSATQTSSFDSAQPSSSQSSAHSGIGEYAGITFGAIVGIGVTVALVAYWLRVRHRIHRRAMKRMTTWPWDHDRLGAREDTLERGGSGARAGLRTWDAARMVEASTSDAGKTRFAIEDEDGLPASLPKTGPHLALEGSRACPLPPASGERPPYAVGSPFVAVPLHAARGREQSVPDMMQEMGTLKITNLMPGDIVTSGGESSRASTALGFSDGTGSPDSDSEGVRSPATPRATSTLAAGDDTTPTPTQRSPWAPLRTWKTNGAWQEGHMLEDGDDVLPFPGNSPAAPEPEVEAEAKQDGWAVSIRANLVNALNAVVGSSAAQAHGTPTENDNLTRPPERRTSQRRGARGRRASTGDMESQLDMGSSAYSPARWSLEEMGSGRGVVRFRGYPEQGSALTEDPFSDDSQVAPGDKAAHKDERDSLETFDNDRTPGTSNEPPTSPGTTEATLRRSHPSQLASIPSASGSSCGGEAEEGSVRKKMPYQHRKRTKRRRPTAVRRKSSSQSSAVSVGSDMSRTSSVPSEGLTDAERFAKHVLRERRRRVMEMAVGQSKPSRSRATTISRRRPKEKEKEKLKQRVEKEAS